MEELFATIVPLSQQQQQLCSYVIAYNATEVSFAPATTNFLQYRAICQFNTPTVVTISHLLLCSAICQLSFECKVKVYRDLLLDYCREEFEWVVELGIFILFVDMQAPKFRQELYGIMPEFRIQAYLCLPVWNEEETVHIEETLLGSDITSSWMRGMIRSG